MYESTNLPRSVGIHIVEPSGGEGDFIHVYIRFHPQQKASHVRGSHSHTGAEIYLRNFLFIPFHFPPDFHAGHFGRFGIIPPY